MKVGDEVICLPEGRKYDYTGKIASFVDAATVQVEGPYGGSKCFPLRSCKLFFRIEDEQLDKEHAEMFPRIVEMARDLFEKFLPGKTFDAKDNKYLWCEGVSLDPCVVHRKSISSVREIPGWSVSVWEVIPATRWEPENCDVHTIGEYNNFNQAVVEFVKTVFGQMLDDHLMNQAVELNFPEN
jgi:hypothetical protein